MAEDRKEGKAEARASTLVWGKGKAVGRGGGGYKLGLACSDHYSGLGYKWWSLVVLFLTLR